MGAGVSLVTSKKVRRWSRERKLNTAHIYLIDGRLDPGYLQQLLQMVDGEVADADAPAIPVSFYAFSFKKWW